MAGKYYQGFYFIGSWNRTLLTAIKFFEKSKLIEVSYFNIFT